MAYTCPDIQGYIRYSGHAPITNTRYYDASANLYYTSGATLPSVGNGDNIEVYCNGSWHKLNLSYDTSLSPAGWRIYGNGLREDNNLFVFQIPSSINGKSVTTLGQYYSGSYAGAYEDVEGTSWSLLDNYPYTIPSTVKYMPHLFYDQQALEGLITINANPTTYTDWLKYTQNDIKLTGNSTMLGTLASGYNNVTVLVKPNISVLAQRCDSQGNLDDENGTYAKITLNIEGDPVNTTYDIDIKVDGVTEQLITNETVSSYAEEQKIFVIGSGAYNIHTNYNIEVEVSDSWGVYTVSATDTLSTAFYTIDVGNAGREVAFGAPANDVLTGTDATKGLFKCDMNAKFNGDVHLRSGDSPIGLTDMVVEPATISTTSISANTAAEFDKSVSKPDYYPIGVVGFSCATGSIVARRMYIDTITDGSCRAVANVRNASSSAASASSVTVYILWIKSS